MTKILQAVYFAMPGLMSGCNISNSEQSSSQLLQYLRMKALDLARCLQMLYVARGRSFRPFLVMEKESSPTLTALGDRTKITGICYAMQENHQDKDYRNKKEPSSIIILGIALLSSSSNSIMFERWKDYNIS